MIDSNISDGMRGRLSGQFEWLIALVLFPLSLGLTFHLMGSGWVLEPLMLPCTMVIAVGVGLRLRMAGVLAITAALVLVTGYAWVAQLGVFDRGVFAEHLLFAAGLVFLFIAVTFMSALVAGYHLRTAEITREREQLLHSVLDTLPIGIWVRARSGRTVFINERCASFSGMTAAEIMRSDSVAVPVGLGTEWEAERQALFASEDGAMRYQQLEMLDDRGRPSLLTLLTLRIYIDGNQGGGSLSLLVDETALHMYQEQVRVSEDRLGMALETLEMGFWEQDLVHREIFRDANWYRILEVDAAQVLDQRKEWQDRIHPDDHDDVLAAYVTFIGGGKSLLEIDYRIRKGEESYIWVQDRVAVLDRDATGIVTRMMGTMQDISIRKQVELDLKQAKESAEAGNRAKGHFIATISHEIRTPLNAIIGLSNCLNESHLTEEQLDLSEMIHSSGKSLLLLVNDILDFSKIEAGRLDLEVQEFPLRLCFEESVKLFKIRAAERNVGIRLTFKSAITEFALGDMERLRQILQNLLANALKFSDGGEVEVSLRAVKLSELPPERRPHAVESIGYLDQIDHDYLEVRVSDCGIGIPEDRQHLLFEAFSQVDASASRKYGGTGLGLAICHRLVNAMGGMIWLESREGIGTVFGFVVRTKFIGDEGDVFPLPVRAVDKIERIAAQHPCSILVVGELDQTRRLLHVCRQLGYAPHHAPSYDLSGVAYQRRRYNIVFIWMGDELAALDLSRKISAAVASQRADVILGIVPSGMTVSKERCKLVGIQRLIEGKVSSKVIREEILGVPHGHD